MDAVSLFQNFRLVRRAYPFGYDVDCVRSLRSARRNFVLSGAAVLAA